MEWLIESNSEPLGICPKSACFTLESCGCRSECAKNKGPCFVEFGGPSCNSKTCVVYVYP